MADLGVGFDPNSDDMKSGLLLEPGDYRLVCVEDSLQVTKGGREYLEFVWQVFEGNGHNRKIWDKHYVFDGEEAKLKAAKARLGRLLHAAGIKEVFRNSSQMKGRKIVGKVTINQSDEFEPSNRISSYKPLVSNGPQAFSGEAITAPAGQIPPW